MDTLQSLANRQSSLGDQPGQDAMLSRLTLSSSPGKER